jgi:hypothetical protein
MHFPNALNTMIQKLYNVISKLCEIAPDKNSISVPHEYLTQKTGLTKTEIDLILENFEVQGLIERLMIYEESPTSVAQQFLQRVDAGGSDMSPNKNTRFSVTEKFHEFIPPDDARDANAQYTYSFTVDPFSLVINDRAIPIKDNTKQSRTLAVIFTDPTKDWQNTEIGELMDMSYKKDGKDIRDIIRAIETRIKTETQITDFFECTMSATKINPAYTQETP